MTPLSIGRTTEKLPFVDEDDRTPLVALEPTQIHRLGRDGRPARAAFFRLTRLGQLNEERCFRSRRGCFSRKVLRFYPIETTPVLAKRTTAVPASSA